MIICNISTTTEYKTFAPTFVPLVITHWYLVSRKVLTLDSCCRPPVSLCLIPLYCREGCALSERCGANKFTLNKGVISLLILSPNCLAAAKIVLHDYISVTQHTGTNNLGCKYALIVLPLNGEGQQHFHCVFTSALAHVIVFNLANITIVFSASAACLFPLCRLKKKSQSVDIASQGFSPTLVPASPLNKAAPPVAKTTTVLAVQENNTTNSQRRSPRCGELKRGYTIGKWHRDIGFCLSLCIVTDDIKWTRSHDNSEMLGNTL